MANKEISGGAFNLSNPKSDIDWMIKDAASKPSPGSYEIKAPAPSGGSGKFPFVWKPTDPKLAKLAKGVNRVKNMNRIQKATSAFTGGAGGGLLSKFKKVQAAGSGQ